MPKQILHTALFHYPHHLSLMLAHSDGNLHMVGANHSGNIALKLYVRFVYLRLWLLGLRLRYKILLTLSLPALTVLGLTTLFLTPQNVSYSFSESNCFSNPVFLPNLASSDTSGSFSVTKQPSLSVGSYPLTSNSSCVYLNEHPKSSGNETIKLSALGLLHKTINVEVKDLPSISPITDLELPVSPNENLEFSLNVPDKTFGYEISIDGREQSCKVNEQTLSCSLENFELTQGQKYQLGVTQSFKDTSNKIFESQITLRDPVVFVSSSIVNEQVVYDARESLMLTANKNLKSAGNIVLKHGENILKTSSEIDKKSLNIKFEQPLPRDTKLSLSIDDITADDGAFLPETYVLSFTTSGGPKVAGISIGNYKVGVNGNIVIRFDSDVNPNQNLNNFISISGANGSLPVTISVYKNSVTVNPNDSLPSCSAFNVKVSDGLQNSAGITGGSSWTLSSRTICQQIFSVGTSVQGRALTGYKFGSGPTKLLFVGGMHGNERSSYRTLIAWVDELELRYGEIPTDKTVIIIPDINPDGYAHQTRTNANGVDLNRNFPSNDWVTGVYMPGGIFLENGGGATPLDQPESSALASYINSVGPRAVLTYHAVASSVISNGAGDSSTLANIYASNSGYASYSSSHEDGIFNYPTTGEFETWLADKKSIPTLLVELSTMSSNELYSQRSALWAMLGI